MKTNNEELKVQYHNWNEISINKYYEIAEIFKSEDTEFEMWVRLLAALCDVDEDAIYNLPYATVQRMFGEIRWVHNFNAFNANNDKIKFKQITINGTKYNVDVNLQNFTVSQYIDFQTFWKAKDLQKYYGNILAIFFIPEGHKYGEDYDISKLAEDIRDNVSIVTANQVCFFFLNTYLLSIRALLIYCNWILKRTLRKKKMKEAEMIKEKMQELEKTIMDGFPSLIK